MQLEDAERKIEKLEVENKELVEEKQTLDAKLRRGSEAIKRVSKEQEKLESKLQKLSNDRDAAVAEDKVSKAKVTSLEVRIRTTSVQHIPTCMYLGYAGSLKSTTHVQRALKRQAWNLCRDCTQCGYCASVSQLYLAYILQQLKLNGGYV